MEAPLLEDQAFHIETLIELGAEYNATAIMVAVGGPLTGTTLLLNALPMTVATPPPAQPHAKLNGPASNVRRRKLEEELDELQEQVSQLKAKMPSRGL